MPMKDNAEQARIMVGPAFEELTESSMMDIDAEWTSAVSAVISASSGWCVSGLSISIISYCIIKK